MSRLLPQQTERDTAAAKAAGAEPTLVRGRVFILNRRDVAYPPPEPPDVQADRLRAWMRGTLRPVAFAMVAATIVALYGIAIFGP